MEISESFDGSAFIQKDRTIVGKMDASTNQLIELLNVTQDEYRGELTDSGLKVVHTNGEKVDERLLPSDTLQLSALTEYEKSLIGDSKTEGTYKEFDPSSDNWFVDNAVAVTPISLEDGYSFWEFRGAEYQSLITKQGVEVWLQMPMDDSLLNVRMVRFEELRDVECELSSK